MKPLLGAVIVTHYLEAIIALPENRSSRLLGLSVGHFIRLV
jgi:hypothetical protein